MEVLLVGVSQYKKRDPPGAEEEEYVENLCDILSSSLQHTDCQQQFLELEGLHLMLLVVKKKKYAKGGALRVLDHALQSNTHCCTQFVDVLGLKTLFAAFMKRTSKKKKKASKSDEDANEEHILSIILYLLRSLEGSHLARVYAKFEENEYEKVEQLLDLHSKYWDMARAAEEEQQEEREQLEEGPETEEYLYLKRLDKGGLKTGFFLS
jgi:beta-catenin-like protein 1